MANDKCIAVLDTGAGGLSVVKALRSLAPRETIYYYADYAHLPYGLKSPELIRHLALKAASKLVALSSCKLLIIACHTISVWWDLEELSVRLKVPVIGMLSPSIKGLKRLLLNQNYQSFGIVSTQATISSGAYRRHWPEIDQQGRCTLVEQACGPLVSLVEEGFFAEQELSLTLNGFLPAGIKEADAILLGCTHFSALRSVFAKVLAPHAEIIDAGDLVAREVLLELEANRELSHSGGSVIKAFVSDNCERFNKVATRFIDEPLSVTLVRDEVLV
ncbi:MAG TPA: glutamate racemase [Myxococcota bacterium]|nr:glutamate racemase [Myxococcota bacterium]